MLPSSPDGNPASAAGLDRGGGIAAKNGKLGVQSERKSSNRQFSQPWPPKPARRARSTISLALRLPSGSYEGYGILEVGRGDAVRLKFLAERTDTIFASYSARRPSICLQENFPEQPRQDDHGENDHDKDAD